MTEGEQKQLRGQQLRDKLELLSEDDFALAVGVTVSTLQTWRATGVGPKYTKVGKTVFYRNTDISEYANSNVQTPVQRSLNQGTD